MKILFFLESELEQVKRRILLLRNICDARHRRQSQMICYIVVSKVLKLKVLKVLNTFNTAT